MTVERLDVLMEPWMERWRGRRGLLGWLVLKWDVFMLKRFAAVAKQCHREYEEARRS